MNTIIFAGGGTAGHVIPNIALMKELQNKATCLYIGTNGIEKQLIEKHFGKEYFFEIECQKLQRKITPSNLKLPFSLAKSIKKCRQILKNINPSLVFAKGGYASFPVVWAAKQLKIPIYIHESDFSLGLANKICARYCKKIFTTFDETAKKYKNAICTGSPLRQEIYTADKRKGLQSISFDGKRKIITISGGSLGAKRLNDTIEKSIDKLTKDFDLFVITGKGKKIKKTTKGFQQREFADNIFDIFACSDLVISRCGSNTACELMALKKPTIFVPLSQATRGEQIQNANYFSKRECCFVIPEEDLDEQTLTNSIHLAFQKSEELKLNQQKLKIDGTDQIVKEILSELKNQKPQPSRTLQK